MSTIGGFVLVLCVLFVVFVLCKIVKVVVDGGSVEVLVVEVVFEVVLVVSELAAELVVLVDDGGDVLFDDGDA